MNDVKIYDCHNCISIFNTDKWVRYADYLILQHENKELIEAGLKIVNHIISNANTLTDRELLKMCGDFNGLKK